MYWWNSFHEDFYWWNISYCIEVISCYRAIERIWKSGIRIVRQDDLPVANRTIYRSDTLPQMDFVSSSCRLPHPSWDFSPGISPYITLNYLDVCNCMARATERQMVIRVFIRALIAARLHFSNLYRKYTSLLDIFVYLHRV